MKGLYVLKEKRIYKENCPLGESAGRRFAGRLYYFTGLVVPAKRPADGAGRVQGPAPADRFERSPHRTFCCWPLPSCSGMSFYSGALVNFFVCALSLANRVKIEVRDEPVFPRTSPFCGR